jgi:hypothetical protein
MVRTRQLLAGSDHFGETFSPECVAKPETDNHYDHSVLPRPRRGWAYRQSGTQLASTLMPVGGPITLHLQTGKANVRALISFASPGKWQFLPLALLPALRERRKNRAGTAADKRRPKPRWSQCAMRPSRRRPDDHEGPMSDATTLPANKPYPDPPGSFQMLKKNSDTPRKGARPARHQSTPHISANREREEVIHKVGCFDCFQAALPQAVKTSHSPVHARGSLTGARPFLR